MRDPKTGSFEQAFELIQSGTLRPRYGYYDLWVFLPDGDKTKNLANLEESAKDQKAKLIACYLTPEVEVALIAGHPKADTKGWKEKKENLKFKEAIFEPFLAENGNLTAPGQGREKLMREALKNYQRMKQLVPELAQFESRVGVALNG